MTLPLKPMISPMRREQLQKVYSLVGTHSAVKLCRWQKAMMRNRGGCYKYTFYGIKSHRCVEATPSLGCANKCTFCWRLNANPTVTEWKFATDPPEQLAQEMIEAHRNLVKNVQGMPGVEPHLLEEAMQPKHCALSLIGEPIIYPKISEFMSILHLQHQMTTFLVQNGQFPEAIRNLTTIPTQLYLSLDASNKETLKKLDRPIFADFWDRTVGSIEEMRRMAVSFHARTVFRLTLIEGWNMEETTVSEYAELINRGAPSFIELKQVTPAFQGNTNSPFRMENVPEWPKVVGFAEKLQKVLPQYGIASSHEHSKCILMAKREDFYYSGSGANEAWHTWIDFDKFTFLKKDQHKKNPAETELPPVNWVKDVALPTPTWATHNSAEEGFDPLQRRHRSNRYLRQQQRELHRNDLPQNTSS